MNTSAYIQELTLLAPAKINLTLDITGRRDDGYHWIETIMQSVEYTDEVTVRLHGASTAIQLQISDESLPNDSRNTAYRAAALFFQEMAARGREPAGAAIRIQKSIPMEAGLAGGSADAAAVIVALNRLTDSQLTPDELCAIGEKVGADVPFCILGGAAMATGVGTILSPLPPLPPCWLVIAKPPCGVSTAEAYRLVDTAEILRRPHQSVVADALCAGDCAAAARELCNVFEQALALPEVHGIEEEMRRYGTLGCQMTGSGSAVFGIFEEKAAARQCADSLRKSCAAVHVCRPSTGGPYPANRL